VIAQRCVENMSFHYPVLLAEVMQLMRLQQDRGFYCDCTVGGGGHFLAMLRATKRAKFVGIDWDPEAIDYVRKHVKQYERRCFLVEDNYTNLGLILDDLGIDFLNGILFDLGVSYHQLTTPCRGFSFEREGGLLMRMSPKTPSLLEKMRKASRKDIVTILKKYGDVYNSQKIGLAMFEKKKVLNSTLDLRTIVEKFTPKRYWKKNLHRVFQALRIWVNNELNNLEEGIQRAFKRLDVGGRIIAISYHSGEDRIVKNTFRNLQKKDEMVLLHKKIIRPTLDEINRNPRARSAKLRAGEKCAVY